MVTTRSVLVDSAPLFLLVVAVIAAWPHSHTLPPPLGTISWAIAQWMPTSLISEKLQEQGWKSSEQADVIGQASKLEIPEISIHNYENPLKHLEDTYGSDWRDRPVLLKGLWNQSALQNNDRRLSLQGLRKETLNVPYFTDSRVYGALTPDAEAPVGEIVERIVNGAPHKIGSQLLIQEHPELLQEVAPLDVVSFLFGDHFAKSRLLGQASVPSMMLQGALTVPVFVANGQTVLGDSTVSDQANEPDADPTVDPTCTEQPEPHSADNGSKRALRPLTGLHCEPIGNVAVQLSGVREWTLVDPAYSSLLRPAIASDGRAFFASFSPTIDHVPVYKIQTHPGDAVWIPTWTWHSVDYVTGDSSDPGEVSIGASLFHFRPVDFVRRNPLFAVLSVPALVRELIGIATQ